MKTRSSFRWLLLLGAALAVGMGYRWATAQHNSPPSSEERAAQTAKRPGDNFGSMPTAAAAGFSKLQTVSPAQNSNAVRRPAVTQPAVHSGGNDATPVVRAAATPQTRQLVATLTGLELSRGSISPEQAEQWKQALHALVEQGSVAVPAIREFLERNQDLSFAGIQGSEQLNDTSLRRTLFSALQQIGGEEASALTLQALQTTGAPSEIALLAGYLEKQAPGQYRQEILTATRETLAMAAAGQLNDWDVGPLFQVLQSYGDAGAVTDLEGALSKWRYYSTIALAEMPAGEGIPALLRMAQESSPGANSNGTFAWQMLAQISGSYPEAGAALMEAARADKIPGAAWPLVAQALVGDRYQIQTEGSDRTPEGSGPGLKNYHIASGNQNYYSVQAANWTEDQLQQRLGLINQLLASSVNPSAVEALKSAQTMLTQP